MSRFFKSAAFPILIVIVLAFFASKLISDSNSGDKPNFQQLIQQVDNGKVQSVVMRTKDNSLEQIEAELTARACLQVRN